MAITELVGEEDRPGVSDIPDVGLPRAPSSARIWGRAIALVAAALALYLLDKVALLFMDLWMFESLGYESVFWTNFRAGTVLFALGFVAFGAAIATPAFIYRLSRTARRRAIQVGLIVGVTAGYLMTWHYPTFLAFLHAQPFGTADPVFHHDARFYVFTVPAVVTALHALIVLGCVFVVSSVAWASMRERPRALPTGMRRLTAWVGHVSTPAVVWSLLALGAVVAVRMWFARYDIVIKDNYDASVYAGAEYIDATGFFSTVNGFTVSALASLFGFGALALRLRALHRSLTSPEHAWLKIGAVSIILSMIPGVTIDFGFRALTALRHEVKVGPNEPVVQLPFIKRHIDATRRAYDLDKAELRDFVPNGVHPGGPKPDLEKILASPTLRNVSLWPGYVAWMEQQLDPEYVPRLLETGGDTMIYGPSLQTFQAQEKLRPYYDFMDLDTVRYNVDGKDVLMASAVRELPLVEPQPWLAWWGQSYFLFTHGFGMVATPISGVTSGGMPSYAVGDLPPRTEFGPLQTEHNEIYYGEGAGTMGYSNVREVPEHDFPTNQGRAELFYPKNVKAGVHVDSLLKRLVIGYKSRQFLDVLFSRLIDKETRVHYFRTPLERFERIAPFLYADTDPYAVVADGNITWMVNGISTADRYPYSMRGELGDKSHVRTTTRRSHRWVNYAKDAVKATVNAYTGQVEFYKWADEPVIDTWANVYPGLFKMKSSMPKSVREQVQYPQSLFHLQYDDLYIFYGMKDPLTFFSLEDLWDDGDEVVGPILTEGPGISFSIEPYYWVAQTGKELPAARDPEQFSMSQIFTPESALNLRAIVTVYMDGDDYGRINILRVPKGRFVMGPEQADAAIDQDAFISQQIGLWNREGIEVIRGHTTALVVDNELIYVEPLFIRSKQNPVPQVKKVTVVLRGQAFMGDNIEDALRQAVKGIRPGGGTGQSDDGEPQEKKSDDEGPPAGRGPHGG